MLEIAITRRLAAFDLAIRLTVESEIVGLFGPSGAGKSMTLKMVAGVETPDTGFIRCGERVFFDAPARTNLTSQARRVGYMPQRYALFPHLSALDNVAYPLRHGRRWDTRRARARGAELLDMVGLTGASSRAPGELSGGQQQRVALARALAAEPEIMLLDEPFAAVDAPSRAELRRDLLAIQARLGIPMLFVTHDLEEASTLASRLVVVIDGRVRQDDRTRVVLDRPADAHVAELVQARNILAGTVRQSPRCGAQTAVGDLPLSRVDLLDGAAVWAIVRPEAIRLVHPGRPAERLRDDALFDGVVREVIDHGVRMVVRVEVADGQLEASLSPSAAARRELAPGSPVRLAVPPGDIHVVPR